MAGREFVTAAQQAEKQVEFVEWELDGEPIRFYEPKATQLSLMVSMRSRFSKKGMSEEDFYTLMNFMWALCDQETEMWMKDRLNDPTDPFDIDPDLLRIFDALMSEWSGKVSNGPSDFRKSESPTGPSSTGNTQGEVSTSYGWGSHDT